MKLLHEASNAIEAQLLADLLGQEGVSAHILGAYLQGGVGELPAAGLVRLMVDEADLARAQDVLQRWEAGAMQVPEVGADEGGVKVANVFDDARPPTQGERFEPLLSHRNLVVERIVSSARLTPVEYVQPQDEWVLLLKGHARLEVQGREVLLREGDHLFLPAGCPHTVREASDGAVWLAVHLHPDGTGPSLV